MSKRTWTMQHGGPESIDDAGWNFFGPDGEKAYLFVEFTRAQARAVLDLVRDVYDDGKRAKARELRNALDVMDDEH